LNARPKDRILPVGKLPNDLLARLLRRYIRLDRRVAVGPAIGEDAAAIRLPDRYLIAKTDPITFVTDDIGFYALHINANDLVTMGAVPRWFLVTLLLPEGKTTPALVERIFGLQPMGLIASGALLLSVHPKDSRKILERLHQNGIKASAIGKVVQRRNRVLLRKEGRWAPLPRFKRDEIARLFG
jgi:hydrogenase maturation factor